MTKFLAIAVVAAMLAAGAFGVSKFSNVASSINNELSGKTMEQVAPAKSTAGVSRASRHQLQQYQETAHVAPKTSATSLAVLDQLFSKQEEPPAAPKNARRTRQKADPLTSSALAALSKVLQGVSPTKLAKRTRLRM